MRGHPPPRRGYALIMTLTVMALMIMVAIGMTITGNASLEAALNEVRSERASYAAEAGVAAALVALKNNPQARTVSGTLPPEAVVENYTATIYQGGQSVPNGAVVPTGALYILATGVYRDVSRQVGVTLTLGGNQPVASALFASQLTLNGGATVDSYNSTLGPYSASTAGSQGNVTTNSTTPGSIELLGGSYVKGTINIGKGGVLGPTAPQQPTLNSNNTVWLDWNCYCTGEAALTSTVNLPPVNVPNLGATAGDLSVGFSGAAPAPGYYGAVSVGGGGTLTLSAGTYVFDNLIVNSGGKMVTTGAVALYINQTMNMNGGANSAISPPSNFVVMMANGATANIGGGTQIAMVVYGPNANLSMTGGNDLYGALVGNNVQVIGGSHLHYDVSLQNFSFGGASGNSSARTILGWQRF